MASRLKKKVSLLVNSKRYYKIPWFEDYCINIDGEIRLFNNPDITLPRFGMSDYINDVVVLTRNDGITIVIELDKLMMCIFVGKLFYRIIHKDHDRLNCNIKNLKYDVPYEDMKSHIFDGKEFRQIPEFSRYYISDDAIIWNDQSKIFMRIGYNLQHYPNLHMINNEGKDIHTKPHILLMNTWGPKKKDPKMVCNHKDSIEYHNVLDNLEWMYQYENIYVSYLMGEQENSARAILDSTYSLDDICQMIVDGYTDAAIASKINIGAKVNQVESWINRIRNKEISTHISDLYF